MPASSAAQRSNCNESRQRRQDDQRPDRYRFRQIFQQSRAWRKAMILPIFYCLTDNQSRKLIISTDAHIVSPIFFPGGDIGRLAVSGTVNDVSMSGGEPLYLTASFIIEEGFPIADLERIAESMRQTADEAGVMIVAGDTKVTEKGKTDKIFISTTGIGLALCRNGNRRAMRSIWR